MKRQTVYAGAVPLETDLLLTNKNVFTAIGHVLQDMLGTSTLFSGLACVPTAPAGMTVNVNPGRAYSLQAIDTGAWSSLSADAHQIMKQGILLDAQNFSCPAPGTAGFSINYLIQGAFQEVDTGSTVLPYYNATNPSQAYNGPNGTGTSQTTARDNTVQLQVKAGVAATTGSQITPTPDAGFNGLWVVTVPFGASTITSSNISQYSGAPFLTADLLTQIGARALLAGSSTQTFSVAPATQSQHAPQMGQVAGIVGSVRNLSMSVSAASATATLTADEIIVETALGGVRYCLANFSKTINLATTGAGGMDTGAAPVSGFVAIYAIFNPTTQTAALLATNATAAAAPNVYSGANMPAGYTASALVSVWSSTAASLLAVALQKDRNIYVPSAQWYSSSIVNGSLTPQTCAVVPRNAIEAWGTFAVSSTTSGGMGFTVAATATGSGTQTVSGYAIASTNITGNWRTALASVAGAPALYTSNISPGGTTTCTATVTGYSV